MIDALILCPLALELEAMLDFLKKASFEIVEERAGPLKIWLVRSLRLRMALAGHGKTQFGIQTQFLLSKFPETKIVFCAGCAGALDVGLEVGDVVVASHTVEHDFRLRFISRPVPSFAGDAVWIQKISRHLPKKYRLQIGVVASGDEDIIDHTRAQELKTQTNAVAVAWEGAGGARACQFNSVSFIEIRGITDAADSNAPADFKLKIQIAMANVCDTLVRSLSNESSRLSKDHGS